MVLNIVLVLLILGVAYFHFSQGLLAATVSLFCAAVAAFMAFSYHESVVAAFSGGRMAAYANGIALCVLFAVIYVLLRFVTDNLIVGNARYPMALDKGGAAVVGLVAALFPAAIIALAAQELPFGATVAGYAPLPVEDTALRVPNQLSSQFKVERGDDVFAYDQLRVTDLTGTEAQEQRQSLWVPVDNWFLGLVAKLSTPGSGSLAGATDFKAVYPDFKIAAFADRLGMQRSATQVALNIAGKEQVGVSNLFELTFGPGGQFPAAGIPQVDGDVRDGVRDIPATLKPAAGKRLLVVRISFKNNDMADRGGLVRFSPATCRLVAGGKQFFPVGTLESTTIVVNNLPDDFLLADRGADLIYQIDDDAIEGQSLVAGAFLEFKRFGRVPLDDKKLLVRINQDPSTFVLRKIPVQDAILAKVPNDADGRTSNPRAAFDVFRSSVPTEAGDPSLTQPDEKDKGSAEPAEGGNGGPMDTIRGGAEQRNKMLENGGQQ